MTEHPVAFMDSNVLLRHLTGDPEDQASSATRFLAESRVLLLADLILAEVAFVLSSYYEAPRPQVATALRAILAFPAVRVADSALLHRAVEIYEFDRLHFAEAYIVASAERSGVGVVASFDRAIDRVATVVRLEPG